MVTDQFIHELRHLLNVHSIDNDLDTPDFVLASYLAHCLLAFGKANNARLEFEQPY